MSKSWSEVIENIDLSTKPLREPRKLSCDEITDLKEKCNPQYDLTITDLICTIEALQQENDLLRHDIGKLNEYMSTKVRKYAGENCVDSAIEHIEALQQKNEQLRDLLHDAKCEIYDMPCLCYGDRKCDRCKTIEDIDKVLGGKKDV